MCVLQDPQNPMKGVLGIVKHVVKPTCIVIEMYSLK